MFPLLFFSCTSLHAISVFEEVKIWSPASILHFKIIIKCFKEEKTKTSDRIYHAHFPQHTDVLE